MSGKLNFAASNQTTQTKAIALSKGDTLISQIIPGVDVNAGLI